MGPCVRRDDTCCIVSSRIRQQTDKHNTAISPRIRASFASNIYPLRSEGTGNAGRPERPQPRV